MMRMRMTRATGTRTPQMIATGTTMVITTTTTVRRGRGSSVPCMGSGCYVHVGRMRVSSKAGVCAGAHGGGVGVSCLPGPFAFAKNAWCGVVVYDTWFHAYFGRRS